MKVTKQQSNTTEKTAPKTKNTNHDSDMNTNKQEENTMTITKETTLKEILSHEGAEEILSKYRLPCLHCPMSAMEMGVLKLGEVCQTYGIDGDKVLEELQQLPSAQE